MSILFSAWTVLVAVVFLGIVIWVFREKKENFDKAANIPFEEDTDRDSLVDMYHNYFLNGVENYWRKGVFHYATIVIYVYEI